jgi:hypothetical protein
VRRNTIKSVNKVHPRERLNMTFIDRWSFLEVTLFYSINEGLAKRWPLFTRCSVFRGGIYLEVALFYFINGGLAKGDLYLQGALYSEMVLIWRLLCSLLSMKDWQR